MIGYDSKRGRDIEYIEASIKASEETTTEIRNRHPELKAEDFGEMTAFMNVLNPRDGEPMLDYAERVYSVWKFSKQTAGSTQGA